MHTVNEAKQIQQVYQENNFFLGSIMGKISHAFTIILSMIFFLGAQESAKSVSTKIGINNSIILDNSDFKSGYTGSGIFFERCIPDKISVFASINSFKIRTSASGKVKAGSYRLSTYEFYVGLHYRYKIKKTYIYPEIALGSWGRKIPYTTMGFGLDVKVAKHYLFYGSAGYLVAFQNIFDPGGSGWTSSMLKISLGLAYFY